LGKVVGVAKVRQSPRWHTGQWCSTIMILRIIIATKMLRSYKKKQGKQKAMMPIRDGL